MMKTFNIIRSMVFASFFMLCTACQYGDIAEVAMEKAGIGKKTSESLFVAVGQNGAILYSTNGATWTDTGHSGNTFNAVIYANGCFVAAGDAGVIARSTDGKTWTDITPLSLRPLYGIVYGNGMFVAVGAWQSMLCQISASTDGTTWVDRSENFDNQYLYTVVFGNNRFFTVGNITTPPGGRWSSTAAMGSWTVSSVGIGTYKAGIFANGRFTITGSSGIMMYSTDDCLTWSSVSTGYSFNFDAIVCGNGKYVIVGSGGQAISSADGLTAWTSLTTNRPSYDLLSIAWGNGRFVAVGAPDAGGNNVIWSADGITWNSVTAGGLTLRGIAYRP